MSVRSTPQNKMPEKGRKLPGNACLLIFDTQGQGGQTNGQAWNSVT
jgi:hypothetical protein